MPSQRDILTKISAIKKTRQITRAMNMVAAAKFKGIQEKKEIFSLYSKEVNVFLNKFIISNNGLSPDLHPLLLQPKNINNVGVILITADRGLCGSFNMNLINTAIKFAKERIIQNQNVLYYIVGRKGRDFFRRQSVKIKENLVGNINLLNFDLAIKIAKLGIESFLVNEVQEVYMIFSKFQSISIQIPTVTKLLPLSSDIVNKFFSEDKNYKMASYIIEPSAKEFLAELLPNYINVCIFFGLLESAASEQAARMVAMDNATKNCKDMLNSLTLAYNKVRQANITAELMDIVGGVEALKG